MSLIFVTHDTRDAFLISDRIGVVQKGRMVQIDTPKTLYEHPVSPYVAHFLGIVNEFDSNDLEMFNFKSLNSTGQQTLIRAEDISISSEGYLAGIVTGCRFLGVNFLITITLKNGKYIKCYRSEFLTLGEPVFLYFDSDKLLRF